MNKSLILIIAIIIHVLIIGSISIPSVIRKNPNLVHLKLKPLDIPDEVHKEDVDSIQAQEKLTTPVKPIIEKQQTEPVAIADEPVVDDSDSSDQADEPSEMSFLIDIDDVQDNAIGQSGLSEDVITSYPEPEDELETVIDFESIRDSYYQTVLSKIDKNKIFPPAARRMMRTGKTEIGFTIHSDGSVSDIRIISRSEFEPFNLAAMEAVKKATPFPSIPDELGLSEIELSVDIVFEMN